MRTLVFIPQANGCTYDFIKAEVFSRLKLGENEGLGAIKPVDAGKHYQAKDWSDLVPTIKYYGDTLDAVVVVLDGPNVPGQSGRIARSVKKIAELQRNLPVIAYVKDPERDTQFNLLSSGIVHIVDAGQHALTLPACVGRAIVHQHGLSRNVSFGPLDLDLVSNVVTKDGASCGFTQTEENILCHLAKRKNMVVTKQGLIDTLYNGMDEPSLAIINVFMCKLRAKLNALGGDTHPGLAER